MSHALWHDDNSRQITRRIVIEGDLQLLTPAHFGSGDEAGSFVPLIIDQSMSANHKPQPMLSGASIAGALRSYVWTRRHNYGTAQDLQTPDLVVAKLFGGVRQDDNGLQSALIVDDAYSENAAIELRDGVKINAVSRTAASGDQGGLYAFAVWSAGAVFRLRFELIICKDDDSIAMRALLAEALDGFNDSKVPITLGARKRRGYGRVQAGNWRVQEFDLTARNGLREWLMYTGDRSQHPPFDNIVAALHTQQEMCDARDVFTLTGRFALTSSILIRSVSDSADTEHLRSNNQPVVSGTSLAGAIRARALKIAHTLNIVGAQTKLIDSMFGAFGGDPDYAVSENKPTAYTASRVTIEEHAIAGGEIARWVQNRVSIDRFTGGALDTALFDEQPHFGGEITLRLTLRNPQDHEIGLLLLVLKDLWTGDLPLGGESSVGRGRLRGILATLTHGKRSWELRQQEDQLQITETDGSLNDFVSALIQQPRDESQ